MKEKVSLFGVKELDDFFEGMARTDQRKIILDAYRAGVKPIIRAARSNLKTAVKTKTDKTLSKSIGFVPLRSKKTSVFASAKVGARRFGRYRGFHGHLVDAGTAERSTSSGKNRGKMPATNFFSRAADANTDATLSIAADSMIVSLNKLVAKKLKKINA